MDEDPKHLLSLLPHLKALLNEVDQEIAANPPWLKKLDPHNWPHLAITPYRP
tara:strand:- start:228 stop:383 length:156 start_codon:yes stop_codon:yes gene_type:complete